MAGEAGMPSATSGAMYRGVPTNMVDRVVEAESQILATPKSATLGVGGVVAGSRRILAGLTSRWITPAAWIASRPTATEAPIQATIAGLWGPSWCSFAVRSPPPT